MRVHGSSPFTNNMTMTQARLANWLYTNWDSLGTTEKQVSIANNKSLLSIRKQNLSAEYKHCTSPVGITVIGVIEL